MTDTSAPYGPGGPAPQVIPSGTSILDRGYGRRTPATVQVALPQAVPTTAYLGSGMLPRDVGPSHIDPPGPLGPLSLPQVWPQAVPYTT